MTIKRSFTIALSGLRAHKSRSGLTILGIVIGIAAIMLIMSMGRGAEKLILGELGAMGPEIIVIRPGQEPSGPTDIAQTLFADSLKSRDVEALRKKSNVPGLQEVIPVLIIPGSVSYGGETFRPSIFGWSAEFMASTFDIYPREGVLFDESHIASRASVAVIGTKVKKELFGGSDALGKNIKIKDRNFKVVGVLPSKGQVSFFNIDEVVIVPYTTAQSYLLGIDHYHEIIARAESPEAVARTVRDIKETLRGTHGITDPAKDDFFAVTQEGVVEQVKSILGILTVFLSSVVAVALVVGGIGVMNIMLVSVTERTREIGLRKALGATDKNILAQFLLEAVMLTAAGGIIGIALGSGLAFGVSEVLNRFLDLDFQFAFPVSGALLGLGAAAFVGLIFGIYPARQAAKKSPIEALRYE